MIRYAFYLGLALSYILHLALRYTQNAPSSIDARPRHQLDDSSAPRQGWLFAAVFMSKSNEIKAFASRLPLVDRPGAAESSLPNEANAKAHSLGSEASAGDQCQS